LRRWQVRSFQISPAARQGKRPPAGRYHVMMMSAPDLEHDPEKWKPVFRKDHAQTKG
jgi:hypothetical protein